MTNDWQCDGWATWSVVICQSFNRS
jgi:hypothetical protein